MEFKQIDFTDGKPSGVILRLTADEGRFLAQLLSKQSVSLLKDAGLSSSNSVFASLYSKFEQLFVKGLAHMMDSHE